MRDKIIDEKGMIDFRVSDFDRVIIVYGLIVEMIERVTISLRLDPEMIGILKESVISIDFLSLEDQLKRFKDELIKFDETGITVEAETIDSKRLHILDGLRGRAIEAFSNLVNIRDNTTDDQLEENLKR